MKQILFIISFLCIIKSSFSQILRDDMEDAQYHGALYQYHDIRIPIPFAKVEVKGTDYVTYADIRGMFVISNLKNITTEPIIIISADGYETIEYSTTLGSGSNLGPIFLRVRLREINPININDLMPDRPEVKGAMINNIGATAVYSGNDPLSMAANYRLGFTGFKIRGYDWSYKNVYVNGVLFNDPETGYASPALFAGLNSYISANEGNNNLLNNSLFYGNIGGYSNMVINPLSSRKQFRLSYSYSNSLYNHSFITSYSTGKMYNGWGVTFAASGRLGQGFIEGTDYKSMSFFVSAARAFSDSKLTFFAFGAPTERYMVNYSTQPEYDAIDNNYFNSALGRDGDNYKKNTFYQPVIGLSFDYEGDGYMVKTTASASYGDKSETGFLWSDKVPQVNGSFFWKDINAANDTLTNAGYILDKMSTNRSVFSLNSVVDIFDFGNFETTAGIELQYYTGNYKDNLADLLNGAHWLNKDKFLVNEIPSDLNFYQYNLQYPDSESKIGDLLRYDYNINQGSAKIWNVWRYFLGNIKFSLGASASFINQKYNSNMQNGKMPEAFDNVKSKDYLVYNGKFGVAYKFTSKFMSEMNIFYGKQAPLFTNTFYTPRISGEIVERITPETNIGGEVNFNYSESILNVNFSIYYTSFSDQTIVRSYYDDTYMSNMNFVIQNLSKNHMGADLSTDWQIIPDLTLKAAISFGAHRYIKEALINLYQENIYKNIYSDTLDLSGLYVGGMPQLAFSGGILYNSPKFWWLGLNANFAGNNYVDMNLLQFSKTIEPSENMDYTQEKLNKNFTLDLYGGYTFAFGKNKTRGISLNLNIHNVLNNTKGFIGAYQSLGIIDENNLSKNATRYAYAYGRTMFLILSFYF